MKMHPSKIRKATQRELFATEEYGSSRGSWLVLDGQGKPDRRAMTSLHGKCRKDGRRREQRELARYLARGAGTRKGHGFLLSEFEATLELYNDESIQSLICCRTFTRYALSCSSVVTSMPSPYLFLRSKDSGG